MIVKVTQEHIEKALVSANLGHMKSLTCPVARALCETFKVKGVSAGYEELTVGVFPEDNIVFNIKTPQEVVNKMIDFDMFCSLEKSVLIEPFEFDLPLEGVKL